MKLNKIIMIGCAVVAVFGAIGITTLFRNSSPQTDQPTPDTTAPTLTVSDFADGQTVDCTLSLRPTTTDNKQVQKVEYYIDGGLLYATYAAPFGLDSSMAALADGTHSVKIVSYDDAGNSVDVSLTMALQKTSECQPVAAPDATTPVTGAAPTTLRTASVTTPVTSPTAGPNDTPDNTPPDTEAPTTPDNFLVSFDSNGHFDSLTWDQSTDDTGVDHYNILRDGVVLGASTTNRFLDMRISDGQMYNYQLQAFDAAGNSSTVTNSVGIQLASQGVWTGITPTNLDNDATGVEVGTKFFSRVPGVATGVRFYKDTGNNGAHTGTLWSFDVGGQTGTQVAAVSFTNETASGWQTANFSTPVTLTPQAMYVVSVYLPEGHTSYSPAFYSTAHISDYIASPAFNGVTYPATYRIGSGFPSQNAGGSTGYAVDIAFAPNTPTAPSLSGSLADRYKQWSNGPNPTGDPNTIPTTVYNQWAGRTYGGLPNGTNFKALGIDYDIAVPHSVSLQIQSIADTDWRAVATATSHIDRSVLDGVDFALNDPRGQYVKAYWLDDESDMNQVNYGPNSRYAPLGEEAFGNDVRAADPTRPTYVNYGKGMAIDFWSGYSMIQTGSYATDMEHYCNAGDIVSSDYYGNIDHNEPSDYHGSWTYGQAIKNMQRYCHPDKILWGFVDTNAANSDVDLQSTPDQVEESVWSMLIQGATGIQYFAHQFYPTFVEDALLYDAPMKARVAVINSKIQSYAKQLNAPTDKYGAAGWSSIAGVPLKTMMKHADGSTYVFAQASGSPTHNNSAAVTGTIATNTTATMATVLEENRTVPIVNGLITDEFDPYQVHIYKF